MIRILRGLTAAGTGVAMVLGLAGCQAAATGGGAGQRPVVAVDINPDAGRYAIEKVGILTYANSTRIEEAEEKVEGYVLAALYRSDTYTFVKRGAFARDAERSGVQGAYDRLVEVWRQRLTLNRKDVMDLCEATGMDAVLAYDIAQWEQKKIDINQEGTSTSTVKLRLDLVAADGTILWSASNIKVGHSPPYNPSLNVRATQKGEAIQDESRVPDPPRIEPIAVEVLSEIVSTMPDLRPDKDAS